LSARVAVVCSKHYRVSLGGFERMHPFDVHKHSRILDKLQTDGDVLPEDVFVPEPATDEQILLVHTPEFLESLRHPTKVAAYLEAPFLALFPAKTVARRILQPFRHATGGTILAGRLSLESGIAINLAGGYHHAKPDAGEGFCLINDIAIAIRVLQSEKRITRALVVDLDVHQGNGTAVCFARDDRVYTFSMHEDDIYPMPKETSSRDIELPAGTGDEEILSALDEALPEVFKVARLNIVFFVAGCDVLEGDPLAGFRMTEQGVVTRDARVIDACVARDIPVAMTLGGGYGSNAWAVQHASVKRTIEKYGLVKADPRRAPGEDTSK